MATIGLQSVTDINHLVCDLGCPVDLVPPEAVDFLKFLVVFFDGIQNALQSLNGQNVAVACGEQSAVDALQATTLVSNTVCGAADLVKALHIYLSCSNWFPLYDQGVYQSMCYDGASGFSWVTSTQIAIVVCSMVILTLRVVFQEVQLSEPTALVAEANMENKGVGGEGSDYPDETGSNANEAPSTTPNGSTQDARLLDDDQGLGVGGDSNHDNSADDHHAYRDDDTVASEDIYLESSKDEPKE